MLPVAILAGGFATRLRPLTLTIPKSLIEVNGEPFVAHQLRLLAHQGVTSVVMCVGFLGAQLKAYVGDGSRFGLSVAYSEDGPVPLGTGGALRQALPLLPSAFFVLYGDSYLTCDFAAVEAAFKRSGKPALMTVYENFDRYDRSNVEFRNARIICYDKSNVSPAMHHIDYGLGVFEPSVLQRYSAGKALDLERIYQDLVASGELAAMQVNERFYEIGSMSGVSELSQHLALAGRH